jgi:hypothetical protein
MIYVAPQSENGIEMEKNYCQYHGDARQSNKLKQNNVSHRLEGGGPCLQQLKIFAPIQTSRWRIFAASFTVEIFF